MQQGHLMEEMGGAAMKLKIMVFDPDLGLRELLKTYLASQGHEVLAFHDIAACPLYRNLKTESCRCAQETPCADAILVDLRMPCTNTIDFLKLQRQRGCKALDANKAVMSAGLTKALETTIAEFGCHHIRKPFHLEDIKRWVNGCKERLAAKRASSP